MFTAQKMNFSIKDFFSKYDQIYDFPVDLVIFTEEILNGKLPFLCNVFNICTTMCPSKTKLKKW